MREITVITPLYKGKKYIDNLICMLERNADVLSTTKETSDVKIELVLVNDYPEEHIEEKLYSNRIEITLINNIENQGIHQSRINGLYSSKGKWIQFLDQDDSIADNYMFTQLQMIGDADAALCNGLWRGKKTIYKDIQEQQLATQKEGYYPQKTWLVSPGQLLIKREFIPTEWKENILQVNGSDDALLWLLMLRDSRNIVANPEIVYFHNENGSNASFNFKKMSSSIREMMDIIEQKIFFEKEDYKCLKEGQLIRIKRYDAYANLEEQWENILNSIKQTIEKVDNNKVAIYGYGIIGRKLVEEIESMGINISTIVDKDAANYKDEKKKFYTLRELEEEIELLIVTPVFDKERISREIKGHSYIKKAVMLDELEGE